MPTVSASVSMSMSMEFANATRYGNGTHCEACTPKHVTSLDTSIVTAGTGVWNRTSSLAVMSTGRGGELNNTSSLLGANSTRGWW